MKFCQCSAVLMSSMALLGTLIGGCGSGTGPGFLTPANVTRGHGYSQDAIILASREATGAWIPSEVAAQRDMDLKVIRERFPSLQEIAARPEATLDQVLVGLRPTALWRSAWEAGNLATGESAVDDLLTEFRATKVEKIFAAQESAWFTVTFDQPLNVNLLAERIADLGGDINYAEPNRYAGDGNNITFRREGTNRIYSFSHGWGDCPAGCINRRYWTVTITENGVISVEQSGDELPPGEIGE